MDYKLNIENLNNPADLQKLKSAISELAFDLDAIYTTTAPNLNISARQGTRAIYLNGATYEYWVNCDGLLSWQRQAGQSDVVLLTGDQSIAGIKTFTSIPVLPASDPTTDHQAARKLYVDGKFNTTTGHDHDGANSKQIDFSDILNTKYGCEIFTADGTFTAPTGITKVYLTMIGGGGGGGGGGALGMAAGGGGSGATIINYPYTVVPGNTYAVDVGAGGAGGSADSGGTNGSDGSNTTFNTSVIASGGNKGVGHPSGAGGVAKTPNASGQTGGIMTATSGSGATTPDHGAGGGGGGNCLGSGGNGGASNENGVSAQNNSGAGGGGGGEKNITGTTGGTGGSGIVIVMY